MENITLLQEDMLLGFTYPAEFMRMVSLGLHNLEPWYLLEDEYLRSCYRTLRKMYPTRKLIPLYRRQDSDDFVCYDANISNKTVFLIHLGASPGWEEREVYKDIYHWLRKAVEDCILEDENYEW